MIKRIHRWLCSPALWRQALEHTMTIGSVITVTMLAMPGFAVIAGHRTFSKQKRAMMQPVGFVFDSYFQIAASLANDSMHGVAANASAIGMAIRRNSRPMLSPEIAAQADVLAETSDLSSARIIFKQLSQSLIRYLKDHDATGAFVEVYCPKAKASWLQEKGQQIQNPYLGKKAPGCGTIKK